MLEQLAGLPPLGLGLGIDVHSAQPDWLALLEHAGVEFDYYEVYTRGEAGAARAVREAARAVEARTGRPFGLLYHHEGLDPAYPGGAGDDAVAAAAANLVELDAPWCVEELAYRQVDGRYLDFFMPALLTHESVDVIVENLSRMAPRIGRPIVPENPPYVVAVGGLHVLELLGEVGERLDCGVVLDLGHLLSYQIAMGLDPLARIEALPLERVVEVHLAGARIDGRSGVRVYEDLHGAGDILAEPIEMLLELAPRLQNLKCVTIEVEDASDARALDQARQVSELAPVAELRARARATPEA